MLKVLIILDCDECGHSVNTAAICSTPERKTWEKQIGHLMHHAEGQGWRFFRDYGICPECIQVELTMADWYAYLEEDCPS
ncbi:MAG: hypothetical protein ACREBQ_02835 [Nitrososphaerales archaeon]